MASNYPGSLDSFDTIASDKKTSDAVGGRTHRQMHNDVADALEAVQAELGTDPAGTFATVKARLAAYDAYAAKTSAYTATVDDGTLNVTSGTFTLDLPAANTCTGKTLRIKNSGTGVVTLDGNSTETIEGVLTFPLGPGSYVEITSTGALWILTGGVPETGWRDISSSLNTGVAKSASSGAAAICRVGDVVQVHFNVTISAGSVTQLTSGALTTGFRPSSKIPIGIVGVSTASSADAALGTTAALGYYAQTSPIRLTASAPNPGTVTWTATWITDDTWPTSLPGTAA